MSHDHLAAAVTVTADAAAMVNAFLAVGAREGGGWTFPNSQRRS